MGGAATMGIEWHMLVDIHAGDNKMTIQSVVMRFISFDDTVKATGNLNGQIPDSIA